MKEREKLFPTRLDTPKKDSPEGFSDNVSAHLRFTDFALGEGDGNLDDSKASLDCAPSEVNLEAVTDRAHRIEVDSF